SVLLDWRPVEGIDHFEIEQLELRTGGLGRQQIVGAPSSNHTYRFQNLVLDMAYRFRIRACSNSLCSAWSPPIISSTRPGPADLQALPLISLSAPAPPCL